MSQPNSLGSQAGATSLPIALSTEDAAKVPIPAAPADVNSNSWETILRQPPMTTNGRPGPRRSGLRSLDAAALLLAAYPHPLGAKQLVACMAARRLWITHGRSPQATVAAAICYDIDRKGASSRFAKVGPGLFTLEPRVPIVAAVSPVTWPL